MGTATREGDSMNQTHAPVDTGLTAPAAPGTPVAPATPAEPAEPAASGPPAAAGAPGAPAPRRLTPARRLLILAAALLLLTGLGTGFVLHAASRAASRDTPRAG